MLIDGVATSSTVSSPNKSVCTDQEDHNRALHTKMTNEHLCRITLKFQQIQNFRHYTLHNLNDNDVNDIIGAGGGHPGFFL